LPIGKGEAPVGKGGSTPSAASTEPTGGQDARSSSTVEVPRKVYQDAVRGKQVTDRRIPAPPRIPRAKLEEEEVVVEEVRVEDPRVALERDMLRMARESELKAFGASEEEVEPAKPETAPPVQPGDSSRLKYGDDKRFLLQAGEPPVPDISESLRALDAAGPAERGPLFDRLLALAPKLSASAALQVARRLLRYAPENLDLHDLAGSAHFALGDGRAALRAYSGMVEVRPDDAEAHARYGRALLRLGQGWAALVELREAARLEPGVARHGLDVARLAIALGRTRLAEATLLGVLARNFHPEQGDVAREARSLLAALWQDEIARGSSRTTRLEDALRALRAGALERRAVRIRIDLQQGEAKLRISAPGDPVVEPQTPFAPSGGRLAGRAYTHVRCARGEWKVEVVGGQAKARGRVVLATPRGTRTVPFEVEPGQTATVLQGALAD
jgi:hypothetical protein